MKRSFLLSFFLLSLVLSACSPMFNRGGVSYEDYESVPYPSMMEDSYVDTSSGGYDGMMNGKSLMMGDSYNATTQDRKLIKTGDLSLHVSDVRTAATDIQTLVETAGGDVTYSNVTRGENSYGAYLTVRVPAAVFETTLAQLKAMALYVVSENTNASDVTEYYTDLEARLTNKQAEEKQYLDILADANTVEDTLAVTQALSDVRYEIESLQGQIKSYDSQIDYSTISLTLTEDESVTAASETWNPKGTGKQAVGDFVGFMQDLVDAAIYFVVFGWPLLLIALVVMVIRRRSKSGKKK